MNAQTADAEFPSEPRSLAGWGRFPIEPARVFRAERVADIREVLRAGNQPSYISRGLGRSYGDASLNRDGGVILHTRLNRLLNFNPVEATIECEAGVSLSDILQHILPRGQFLPVVPGTKHVTIGGAIACDIHGKNHHRDGSFSDWVESVSILTAEGGKAECSATNNSEMFRATVGGMGLTGPIVSARIRLRPVTSPYMDVRYRRAADLDRLLDMQEEAENASYSVAWIDCLATGRSLGRGVLMLGEHADAPPSVKPSGRAVNRRRGFGVPAAFPGFLLNRYSAAAFNEGYYRSFQDGEVRTLGVDQFFFPLDSLANWNRLYGRRGLLQYQAVFPDSTARAALIDIVGRIAEKRKPVFLGVLKRMGDPGAGLLSFSRRGYTLAADFPADPEVRTFFRELEDVTLRYGGRIYLAKDATLEPETFAEMYPELPRFRSAKHDIDPSALFSSSQARRLRIVD